MTKRLFDLVPEYVLGQLSDADRRELEAELARSPELRAELAATTEAYAAMTDRLHPVAPPPALKKRLMDSITAPDERYQPFAIKLAEYFDLAVDRVRDLIRQIHDPKTEWVPGPLPGILTMDFDGGPRVATADVGFVKLPAGLHFPWHRHTGHELNYVMKGRVRDFDGTIYGPGEGIEKDAGTEHEFWCLDDEDVLLAVVVGGFEIVAKT
jgi:anti-sigma factor ChrR (cupin superfamily)